MASKSNSDLVKEIDAEAMALGVESVTTEGLTKKELLEVLSDLKATEVEAEPPGFFIAKGKAITSKRGILSSGDKVTEDDLPGGHEALMGFVESKHVEKAPA